MCSLSFRFPDKIIVWVYHFSMNSTCVARLILDLKSSPLCSFLQPSVTSFPTNILCNKRSLALSRRVFPVKFIALVTYVSEVLRYVFFSCWHVSKETIYRCLVLHNTQLAYRMSRGRFYVLPRWVPWVLFCSWGRSHACNCGWSEVHFNTSNRNYEGRRKSC
jgi:hypothetical protein